MKRVFQVLGLVLFTLLLAFLFEGIGLIVGLLLVFIYVYMWLRIR